MDVRNTDECKNGFMYPALIRNSLKFRKFIPTIGTNQRYVAEKIVNGLSTPSLNAFSLHRM